MGLRLLHNLWDETLAGPPPETGLGKLRKHRSFPATKSGAALPLPAAAQPRYDQSPFSRSIAIVQNDAHRNLSVDIDSSPVVNLSHSGSSEPSSPFSPISPGENLRKGLARRKSTASDGWRNSDYDWIVLSALER